MGDKNLIGLKNLTDYKVDDPLDYRIRDLRSVVNKEYLNTKFLKNDANDDNFDLRGDIVRNCEPYYNGLFQTNDLVSKAFVDAEIGKLPKSETDVLKLYGLRAMRGKFEMGDNPIEGIRSTSQDNFALTVGSAKSTYCPISGGRAMQGHIDMGCNPITNIKPFVEDDSSQASLGALKNHVINFDYFHTQRSELKRLINEVSAGALNRKNLDPVERNIDMENVFERVMENDLFKEDDSDLHKVGSVNKDYHKVNQKTYLFRIDYDSQIGYYSMRLSISLFACG